MQEAFGNIKELPVTTLVLHMPAANEKFKLESESRKTAPGVENVWFQQSQWVYIEYHLKKFSWEFLIMVLHS